MKLSVIIPTLNERDNIRPLISMLEEALKTTDWEVIFVDDSSPDQTLSLVEAISLNKPRVRCLKRAGRLGLSSACIDGILLSQGTYAAIMDANLQHDPAALKGMLDIFEKTGCGHCNWKPLCDRRENLWLAKNKLWMSCAATFWARIVLGLKLKDPLSEFLCSSVLFLMSMRPSCP